MFAALNSFLTRAVTGYFLNKSLRFRSSASAYLNRTPATATNRTTWTWSAWVKRGTLGVQNPLFFAGTAPSDYTLVVLTTGDGLGLTQNNASTSIAYITSSALFRDPAAWYHIVAVWNSTSATATLTGTTADRMQLWVNGVQLNSFSASLALTQNTNSFINSNVAHHHALYPDSSPTRFDGEMAEINFVDGQALTPTSFGAYSIYNQWLPKKYTGTYGTNGFYLPFTNTTSTSTLVADSSGNANNWTPNNISLTAGSTYDSLTDVPTLTSATVANYAVLNPLKNSLTLSAANLNWVGVSSATKSAMATMAVTSGKWYFEGTVTSTSGTGNWAFGLTNDLNASTTVSPWIAATGWALMTGSGGANLTKISNNVFTNIYSAASSIGAVIGMAFDVDAGKIWFSRNGVYIEGSPSAGTGASFTNLTGPAQPFVWGYDTSDQGSINFGQQPFVYTPPTGFLALNTFNI